MLSVLMTPRPFDPNHMTSQQTTRIDLSTLKLFSVLFGLLLLQRMNLVVKADLPMLIAGSCSPCVMLCVSAIGVTDTADQNKQHSAKIFQFLTKELELSEDR